jgi:hypothetical protein
MSSSSRPGSGRRHLDPARLPTVLFLDLDKTVIGRANAAVERFFLHRVVKEVADAGELPESARPRRPVDPVEEMASILRPGFGDAMRRLRRVFPTLEVFVCTMGVPATVTELKVPGIEGAAGVRFNRPLFHRGLCQSAAAEDRKLVGACFRQALQALSRRPRYAGLGLATDAAVADLVFRERFLMIDDTPEVAFDAASNRRLLVCPPYTAPGPEGSAVAGIAGIPAAALRSPKVAEYLAGVEDRKRKKPIVVTPEERSASAADAFWPSLAAAAEAAGRRASVDTLLRTRQSYSSF